MNECESAEIITLDFKIRKDFFITHFSQKPVSQSVIPSQKSHWIWQASTSTINLTWANCREWGEAISIMNPTQDGRWMCQARDFIKIPTERVRQASFSSMNPTRKNLQIRQPRVLTWTRGWRGLQTSRSRITAISEIRQQMIPTIIYKELNMRRQHYHRLYQQSDINRRLGRHRVAGRWLHRGQPTYPDCVD